MSEEENTFGMARVKREGKISFKNPKTGRWDHADNEEELYKYGLTLDPPEEPSHYEDCVVHPWDAMKYWLPPEQYKGFLRGNAIKYLARAGRKGSEVQDYDKALDYVLRLVEEVGYDAE